MKDNSCKLYYELTVKEVRRLAEAGGNSNQRKLKSASSCMLRVLPRTGKVQDLVHILRRAQKENQTCAKADYLQNALLEYKGIPCISARLLVAFACEVECLCHESGSFAPKICRMRACEQS